MGVWTYILGIWTCIFGIWTYILGARGTGGTDGRAGGRVGRVQSMGKNPIWELVPGKMNMVILEIIPKHTFFENGSPGQTTMLIRFVSKF